MHGPFVAEHRRLIRPAMIDFRAAVSDRSPSASPGRGRVLSSLVGCRDGEPIRDPSRSSADAKERHLRYIGQPVQVNSIASMDRQLLINNIVGASKAALAYGLPIVHSTVNVKTGLNKPPIPQVRKALEGVPRPTIDRTTINSWEDRRVPSVGREGRAQETDR